ncbi:MAG: hypothetical protein IJ524_02090 [Bacteroidales bacterium]|nr:hypothetical protein [Bacteroidales bacterium]
MRNRYMEYVLIESQSREPDPTKPDDFPMTEGQIRMANRIKTEMGMVAVRSGQRNIKVEMSDDYYVYAKIPANTKKKGVLSVMFMAHLDVTPEVDTNHAAARPVVHQNYDGGDIILRNDSVLSPNTPRGAHLKDLVGKTIVTGDGVALNGADCKTGCAILVTLFERIAYAGKDFEHGDIYFCFSQNEDVGLAAMRMEMSYLDKVPDILIDVDGGDYGKFSVANFTAEGRTYLIKGNSVHASNAKTNGYADARTAMAYFIGQLPPEVHPSNSEGHQGYIHCYASNMLNDGNDYRISFRIRYFDKADSARFAGYFNKAVNRTLTAFPNVDIVLEKSGLQYDNIAHTMHPQTAPVILAAAKKTGIKMEPEELRAGTTGAMMVAAGLPLPGAACIYSGQQAEHSPFEWACIEELLDLTNLCQEIVAQIYKL